MSSREYNNKLTFQSQYLCKPMPAPKDERNGYEAQFKRKRHLALEIPRLTWDQVPKEYMTGHIRLVRAGILADWHIRMVWLLSDYQASTDVGWDPALFVINAGLLTQDEALLMVARIGQRLRVKADKEPAMQLAWYCATYDVREKDRALFAFQHPGIYELAGL